MIPRTARCWCTCICAPIHRGQRLTSTLSTASISPKPFIPSPPRASTSRLPGISHESWVTTRDVDPPTTPRVLSLRSEAATVGELSAKPSSSLKTRLHKLLSTRRPRRALHLFLTSLRSSSSTWTGHQIEGLVHLFFHFRQPTLALEAIVAVHQQGLAISGRMTVKLLREAKDELVFRPEVLGMAVQWLLDSLQSGQSKAVQDETARDGTLSAGLTYTIMEYLLESGRPELAVQVFETYTAALPPPAHPSPSLHAAYMRARGLPYAKTHFHAWRTATNTSPSSSAPSPEPYIALLQLYTASLPPHVSLSRDPATALVRLLKADEIPFTPQVHFAFLNLELSRRRYESFWRLFCDYLQGPEPPSVASWRLALKVKRWEKTSARQRSRNRDILPVYLPSVRPRSIKGPAMRQLFGLFLHQAHHLTHGRPALILPISSSDPRDPSLLTSFLEAFVDLKDWAAAAVVLETFAVHRIEPTPSTHSAVVLGLVKHFEKGYFARRNLTLDETAGLKKEDGIELLRRILAKRKVRVKLWTEDGRDARISPLAGEPWDTSPSPSATEQGDREDDEWGVSPRPAPRWLVQRELRDTVYLHSLLRRCEGEGYPEWKDMLHEARKELLPKKEEVKMHSHAARVTRWKAKREQLHHTE